MKVDHQLVAKSQQKFHSTLVISGVIGPKLTIIAAVNVHIYGTDDETVTQRRCHYRITRFPLFWKEKNQEFFSPIKNFPGAFGNSSKQNIKNTVGLQ